MRNPKMKGARWQVGEGLPAGRDHSHLHMPGVGPGCFCFREPRSKQQVNVNSE